MIGPETIAEAEAILVLFKQCGLKIATAESCTGGLLAAALTEMAGSSAVFERGFVTYTNIAKSQSLGVPHALLNSFGAVSAEVAAAMAEGALKRSNADVTVSITGVAGPGGGSEAKPVGLVHFGLAREHMKTVTIERRFGGIGRAGVREASVDVALKLLRQAAG